MHITVPTYAYWRACVCYPSVIAGCKPDRELCGKQETGHAVEYSLWICSCLSSSLCTHFSSYHSNNSNKNARPIEPDAAFPSREKSHPSVLLGNLGENNVVPNITTKIHAINSIWWKCSYDLTENSTSCTARTWSLLCRGFQRYRWRLSAFPLSATIPPPSLANQSLPNARLHQSTTLVKLVALVSAQCQRRFVGCSLTSRTF